MHKRKIKKMIGLLNDSMATDENEMLDVLESLAAALDKLDSDSALAHVAEIDVSVFSAAICIELVIRSVKRNDLAAAYKFADAYECYDALCSNPNPGFGYAMIASATDKSEDFDRLFQKVRTKPLVEQCMAIAGTLIIASMSRVSETHVDLVKHEFRRSLNSLKANDPLLAQTFVIRFRQQLEQGEVLHEPCYHSLIESLHKFAFGSSSIPAQCS